MQIDSLSFYLSDADKNYLLDYYEKFEIDFEREYASAKNKNLIAGVIFYNIILTDKNLKNRKQNTTNKKVVFSMKFVASLLDTSTGIISRLNSKFHEKFSHFQKVALKDKKAKAAPKDKKEDKYLSLIVKLIKKSKRKTETPKLTKNILLKMLNLTCEYLKVFYSDKNAIKIKDYLTHLQVNLFIAGYKVDESKLKELFGDFHIDAGLSLTDGRNHNDFVKVKDIYGNIENKVYIDFRR